MVQTTECELRETFSERSFDMDRLTVVKGVELCEMNGWTAEDLCDKWESHSLKLSKGGTNCVDLTSAALDKLARELQYAQDKSRRRSGKGVSAQKTRKPLSSTQVRVVQQEAPVPSPGGQGPSQMEDDFFRSIGATPGPGQAGGAAVSPSLANTKRPMPFRSPAGLGKSLNFSPSSYSPANTNVAYGSRGNVGKVEFVFNESLAPSIPVPGARTPRCEIKIFPNCRLTPYNYMYENPNETAEVLDDRIEDLASRMQRKFHIDTLAHCGLPYQGDVFIGGRVCCDSEGRMNSKSVMVEGSREICGGHRVAVNLQSMPSFSLFPGQIICAEGVNTNGKEFTPQRIFQGCPPPFKKTSPADLVRFNHESTHLGGKPMNILVAAGPFTVPGDMNYQPLQDLVKNAVQLNPDVVMLMGPFVDGENDEIANMSELYADFFTEKVCGLLQPLMDETRAQLILIPSLRDLHHDMVYPQAPFGNYGALPKDRVVLAPNPGTIMINEVTIGFTSYDILFELGKQEINRTPKGEGTDRLGRLVSHIIEQRCYSPLYPHAGKNISFSHFEETEMAVTPDILVTPSRMRYFAKDVKQSLCINPGSLTKGTTGGTFAQVMVHPLRRNDIRDTEKSTTHKVVSRTRVEICRI